jgi:ssDNA-binding Zn-finger/Zn-ribbon topoisomerase 1
MEKTSTEEKGIVLGFTCPECGSNELIKIIEEGEEVRTPIGEVTYYPESNKAELDYDYDEEWSDTRFKEYSYLCPDWHYTVEQGAEEDLAEWLMENCPQTTTSEK